FSHPWQAGGESPDHLLLRGEMTEFHGRYYEVPPVKMSPATRVPAKRS
ncbi:MAG: hypothetical protein IPG06_22400, partial [Haliea sp.]|nr:hypothetical protein [Haliea sp.]